MRFSAAPFLAAAAAGAVAACSNVGADESAGARPYRVGVVERGAI